MKKTNIAFNGILAILGTVITYPALKYGCELLEYLWGNLAFTPIGIANCIGSIIIFATITKILPAFICYHAVTITSEWEYRRTFKKIA